MTESSKKTAVHIEFKKCAWLHAMHVDTAQKDTCLPKVLPWYTSVVATCAKSQMSVVKIKTIEVATC